jgi:tubulin-specific chaperone D
MTELLAGFVTSADTGHETLIIASRAALCVFCDGDRSNLDLVCTGLLENLKLHQGQDRVLVPTLEIVSFLLDVGFLWRSAEVDARGLCLLVQKSCYKSGNVRKIDACARLYGGVAALAGVGDAATRRREEGVREARKRLGALMFHPWPKVRSFVVDVVWGVVEGDEVLEGKLKGVDWGKASSADVKKTVEDLGLG